MDQTCPHHKERPAKVWAEPASPEHLLDESYSIMMDVTCIYLKAPCFMQIHWWVYKGISPQVRGQAWPLLLDLEKVKAENQDKYQVWPLHLCLRDPSPIPSFPGTSQAHRPKTHLPGSPWPHPSRLFPWPSAVTGSRDGQVPPGFTLRPPRYLRGTESQRKEQKPGGKSKETLIQTLEGDGQTR